MAPTARNRRLLVKSIEILLLNYLARPAYGATTIPVYLEAFGGMITSRYILWIQQIFIFKPSSSCFACRLLAYSSKFKPHIFTGHVKIVKPAAKIVGHQSQSAN
jgi:hypothetical protein